MRRRNQRLNVVVQGMAVVLLGAAVRAEGADLPFTLQWQKVADLQVSLRDLDPLHPGSARKTELYCHGALPDGRLLYKATQAGAADAGQFRILLFDPKTNAFEWKALLPSGFRTSPGKDLPQNMWPLPDGRILAMHWAAWKGPWKFYLYNPRNDTFQARADLMPSPVSQWIDILVPLSGGRLLLTGYSPTDESKQPIDGPGYIYDLAANTWSSGPAFPKATKGTTYSGVGTVGYCGDWAQTGIRLFNYASRSGTRASVGSFDEFSMTWMIYRMSEDVAMGSEGPQVNGLFYANCGRLQTVGGQFDPVSKVFTWWTGAGPGYGGGGLFRVHAQGQDWLGQVFAGDQTSPWQCKVLDPATGTWMAGPSGTWSGCKSTWTPLTQGGGIAIAGVYTPVSTNLPVYRLVLTSGGGAMAPYVNPLGVPSSVHVRDRGR